nr:tripartite tricarboxylate transporter substrate-binding protein [Burkholderiaceae bacterium]
PADGYTILFVGAGFTVLPSIVKGLPWSPADFRAVLGIGSVPNVVLGAAGSADRSIEVSMGVR